MSEHRFVKIEQDGQRYKIMDRMSGGNVWREVESINDHNLAQEFAAEIEDDDAKRREYWEDAAP